MAFIAPPRAECNKYHASCMTVLFYPLGIATHRALEKKAHLTRNSHKATFRDKFWMKGRVTLRLVHYHGVYST